MVAWPTNHWPCVSGKKCNRDFMKMHAPCPRLPNRGIFSTAKTPWYSRAAIPVLSTRICPFWPRREARTRCDGEWRTKSRPQTERKPPKLLCLNSRSSFACFGHRRTNRRYFCPSLGVRGYPKWVPHSVANGACKSVTRSEMMAEGPLPPDFKVLFYGNSHMRQVRVCEREGDRRIVRRCDRRQLRTLPNGVSSCQFRTASEVQ